MNLDYTTNILRRPHCQSRGGIRSRKILIPPVLQVSLDAFTSYKFQVPGSNDSQTRIFRAAAVLMNIFFK